MLPLPRVPGTRPAAQHRAAFSLMTGLFEKLKNQLIIDKYLLQSWRIASFMSPSRRRWYFGAVIVLPLLGLLSCSMSAEDGYTPLFIAAQNGDAEETRLGLDLRAKSIRVGLGRAGRAKVGPNQAARARGPRTRPRRRVPMLPIAIQWAGTRLTSRQWPEPDIPPLSPTVMRRSIVG